MGQRLVLSVTYKGNELANAYYHWSGYTSPAFDVCQIAYYTVGTLRDCGEKDNFLLAIRALEATGAGFDNKSYDATDLTLLKVLYPDQAFDVELDRNQGIISCFPKSRDDSFNCGEEFATFDIADMTFNFSVCCHYNTLLEVKKYFNDEDLEDIPYYDFIPCNMDYGTLRDFVDGLTSHAIIQCEDGYYSEIA